MNTVCSRARKIILILPAIAGFLFPLSSQAIPFASPDARSAAMGSVGVASHARNAAYYNPALLAAHYEEFDAIGMFPVHLESTTDPGSVKAKLSRLQSADQINDTAAVQTELAGLTGKKFDDLTINGAAVIVPSTTIGATGFVSNYKYRSAKLFIAPSGATVDNSTLEQRSLTFLEIGAGIGQLSGDEDSLLGELKFGLVAKIMLFESYSYTETVKVASLGLNRNQIRRDSMINFDVGLSKEVGVWKMGLVVRNLFSENIKYAASNETFNIGPQARLGLAYESRRTVIEMDIDLTTNEGIGFAKDTAYIAGGVEFKILPRLYVRAGVRQNRVGDALTTGTFGLGVDFWGVQFDVAGQSSKNETALLLGLASSF